MQRRPRVLLIAFGCSPVRGSEGGIGWNRALQAARFCDTWVLCQDGEEGDEIQEYLDKRGPIENLRFVQVPNHWLFQKLNGIPGLYYFFYNIWHKRAYRVAKELHAEHHFDVAHQVSLCTFREPGYVWKIDDLPFIWGPWGGTNNFPSAFLGDATFKEAIVERCRSFLNNLQMRYARRVRRAAKQSALVLTTNSSSRDHFVQAGHAAPTVVPCNGITRISDGMRTRPSDQKALRIIWSGVLETRKALPLLLRALALLPEDVPFELHVLGSGPCQKAWQSLSAELGLGDSVRWLGWIPLADALKEFEWADVHAFTSMRDIFPSVVLEAMASGTPVLCLDIDGMRDMVTEDSGIKIAVETPEQVARDLAEALAKLWREPQWWERLSRGAVERSRQFLWDRRGEEMFEIYQRVIQESGRAESSVPESIVCKV